MLNIINSQGLSNILVIVTRYFGGILLGTGGLVRAYSLAETTALDSAKFVNKDLGIEAKVVVSYSDLQKFQYYCGKNEIKILNSDFDENVKVFFEITKEKFKQMLDDKENLNFKILDSDIVKEKYITV